MIGINDKVLFYSCYDTLTPFDYFLSITIDLFVLYVINFAKHLSSIGSN